MFRTIHRFTAAGLTAMSLVAISPSPVHAQGGSQSGRPISAVESRLQGQAAVIRSVGEYNLRSAQAQGILQRAQAQKMENEITRSAYLRAARQSEQAIELAKQAERRQRRLQEREERLARGNDRGNPTRPAAKPLDLTGGPSFASDIRGGAAR